jgi:hypothetical protein
MKKIFEEYFSHTSLVGNVLLFVLVFSVVFLATLFPIEWHSHIYSILFTLLFFVTAMILETHWKRMVTIAFILAIIEWVVSLLDLIYLTALSRLLIIIFFAFVVIILILQIARTKVVSLQVILSSINGYLLLGLVFSLILGVIHKIQPAAFTFPELLDTTIIRTSDYIYYGFVTFTTLGYGDIAPQIPIAKSMAIFTSVSGQIYVAVIIALLVGKYAGSAYQE